MNISLIGFMGTGKSSVGKELAEKLDYDFVDLDQKIVEKAGREIPEIFSKLGEEYFRDLEAEVTKEVSSLDQQVIATGGGVVLREENIKNLKRNGIIVLLKASPQEILARTQDDDNRPLLEVEEPLKKIKNLLREREEYYDCTPYQIDTTSLPVSEVVEEVLNIVDG